MLKQILFVFEFISMFQICNSFNAKHEHDDLWCNDSTSINLTQNNIFEFDPLEVHRLNFPDGFVFGTASAAYQVHVYLILSVQSVEICITYVREIMINSCHEQHYAGRRSCKGAWEKFKHLGQIFSYSRFSMKITKLLMLEYISCNV
jgi:hypothetical protein